MSPVTPVLPSAPNLTEIVFGKNQPDYIGLPAIQSEFDHGAVTTRWRLTWRERLRVLFGGNIWLQQLTFHGSLQPVKLLASEPSKAECV